MAKGRSVADWGHTSSVMALIANVNRDPKRQRKPYSPSDFNPHSRARRKRPVSVKQLADEMMHLAAAKGLVR